MRKKTEPVDVISVCSTQGDIIPLRIQLADENAQTYSVVIEQILSHKEISYVGNESHIYSCRAMLRQKPFFFELCYLVRSHRWNLMIGDDECQPFFGAYVQ